jgi:hypothetical protein
MRIRGYVVRVKGDWAEFAHSLGFPSWASALFPCLFCAATKEELYKFRGCNPFDFPFQLFTHNLYLAACAACETVVYLTSEQCRGMLLASLAYDKRTSRNSSFGRALTNDIPELGLEKGDRLEPNSSLCDVGSLATVVLPIYIIFWRPSAQTKSKHRNPLFAPETGISISTLAIDILHTLHLGVFQFWAKLCFWFFIDANIYHCTGTQEEKFNLIVLRLGSDLQIFYKNFVEQVGHPITQIQELIPPMLGTSGKRKLKTKAAETRWLIPFCICMLQRHVNVLGDASDPLYKAGLALESFMNTLDASDGQFTTQQLQANILFIVLNF